MNERISKVIKQLNQISLHESLTALEKMIIIQAAQDIISLSLFKEHIMKGTIPTMNIKLLTNTAVIPTKGSPYSAGYDLYADIQEPISIEPMTSKMIGTGIAAEIPVNFFGGIFARSGLASKQGLRPANCVGVIDSDYRGEIKVPIYNDSKEIRCITPHERIAQLIIIPHIYEDFKVVENLSESERNTGGFGSSGI